MPGSAITPEALYLQLGNLVAEMPDLGGPGPITTEMNRWLGRAGALVDLSGDPADIVVLRVASQDLGSANPANNAQAIVAIIHRTLALAELRAPASATGAFIAVGSTLSAMTAVGKVLETAQDDVLLVDPYSDHKVLTDFALLAPEDVTVRLLAVQEDRKPTLKPAAERWVQEHGPRRPLQVRLAPHRKLHDRLIFVDRKEVWALSQSFNRLADRAPASLLRVNPEIAAMKIAAYEDAWQAAQPQM